MTPAATFLHWRPIPCSSNYHPFTANHFLAEAATSPALATTFLQQQPPSCRSNHLPAPAATSSAPAATNPAAATTFLHQQLPALLQQQLPVLNQWLLSCTSRYQQLPVLNQRPPSCASRYQSWTSNHLPALAETSPAPVTRSCLAFPSNILVLSFLPRLLSIIYISKCLRGPVYLSGLCNNLITYTTR